jgi:ADP-heptose:LPS heptosyltransferase
MQSFSASQPRLLVLELWGLGDLALAVPFLRAASRHSRVSVLAKPATEPLVRRFCPEVELIPFTAPWTAFEGKYQLHRWPWPQLSALLSDLHRRDFFAAVSARPDPRDHALMALAGIPLRAGFSRAGSALLLTDRPPRPSDPHRAAHWSALAAHFGWSLPPAPLTRPSGGRQVVMHTGAAQPTRQWGADKFAQLATKLRAQGWPVTILDEHSGDLTALLQTLATADRFIGNDSGPGHLAALLGVPTFTVFGAQLAANFHPIHPQAAWLDGAPCVYKPCHDACRFASPHCIRELTVDQVWTRVTDWLAS